MLSARLWPQADQLKRVLVTVSWAPRAHRTTRAGLGPGNGQRLRAGMGRHAAKDLPLGQRVYAAVFGAHDPNVVELESYRTHGVEKAIKITESAERDAGLKSGHHERWKIGMEAILALLYPSVMWAEHFSAAYGPFERAIPIAELGPGSAPNLIPMPETLGGRFVARLRNFRNQHGVWEIGFALQDAVGVARIEEAVDAARRSGVDVDAVLDVQRQIGELCEEEVAQLTDLWRRMITRFGGTDEKVQAQSEFYQSQRDAFRLAACRGALGLMARGLVSDETFALLYLPFVAFIPSASLDAQ